MISSREFLSEKLKDPKWYPSYEDAFDDCKILKWKTLGSYQGDHVALVEAKGGQVGFAVIGYGSCSGCDALEGTGGEGAIAVFDGIRDGAHWEPTRAAMKVYLESHVDKEIVGTYLTTEEKTSVWPELIAALSSTQQKVKE